MRKDVTKFVHFVLFQITLLHATNLFESSAPFSGQDEVTISELRQNIMNVVHKIDVFLPL